MAKENKFQILKVIRLKINITAVLPAWKRVEQTIDTINRIKNCRPEPNEIIVAVDGNQIETFERIKKAHPDIRLFLSKDNLGPGGNRNLLIKESKNELIASFDDDSYPIDTDYFLKLQTVFKEYSDASVIFSEITEKNTEAPVFRLEEPAYVKSFVGCGCAYRKKDFLKLQGYVPLPIAYGCEEADLALQLHEKGMKVLYHPDLKVFHDTKMTHHANPSINAGSISNLAILAYLRYPWLYLPVAFFQIFNRVWYLITKGRFKGICRGIVNSVITPWKFKQYKKKLTVESFRSYRKHL